jgi:hypothetical protein
MPRFQSTKQEPEVFARYRCGVALDRMLNTSDDLERRHAAAWALRWGRLCTLRMPGTPGCSDQVTCKDLSRLISESQQDVAS